MFTKQAAAMAQASWLDILLDGVISGGASLWVRR
jgi:hypothetical protein